MAIFERHSRDDLGQSARFISIHSSPIQQSASGSE
jgi:hypothetical protein